MKIILKILVHSIFWLVFVIFNNNFGLAGSTVSWPHITDLMPNYFINIIWAAFIFYLFYFYIIRFFEKRLFIKYFILSVLSSVASALIFLTVHKLTVPEFNIFNREIFIPSIAGTFLIAQCGSLVKGFESWFADMQLKSELENLNLRNELALLKAQINPHFLFNTLNNIDSLIHKSPDAASSALITLSEILRYMVYDTKTELVPLEKEIKYIQSYIKLQKMRFKDPEYISFAFDESCKSVLIPPALLFVFIENSFKYSSNIGKLPAIEIKLFCTGGELNFYCKNYFNSVNALNEKSGGVGLTNVKRQLAILYPDRHRLKISSGDNTFIVDLNIRLI